MPLGEREAADLARGRAYIAAARERVHVPEVGEWYREACEKRDEDYANSVRHRAPQNLTDALFGPYTCTRCPSYGHKTSDHSEQR